MSRLSALKIVRQEYESEWRDVRDFILPGRGRFDDSEHGKSSKDKTRVIYDNTARISARTLVAGMMSGASSPARPWMKLSSGDTDLDEYDSVKTWLHWLQRSMLSVFNKSNVYNALPHIYEECSNFSVGGALIMPSYNNVIHAYPQTIGQYWIACNDEGKVDTLYREVFRSVWQLASEFGIDRLPKTIQQQFKDGKLDTMHKCLHVIEPRAARPDIEHCYRDTEAMSSDKPWISVYMLYSLSDKDNEGILRISGYDEFPGMFPRWHVVGSDTWGSECPGSIALPDTKSLQLEQKHKHIGIGKIVDPPMIGAPELENKKKSLIPGGITYAPSVGGQPGLYPAYNVNLRISELMEDIREVQGRINTAYFADLFQMLALSDRRQITATEISERHEEKLLMLGPVLERLQNELLGPLIDRTFAIMMRANMIPPAPKEIEGKDLKVEYISLLAQAQKAVGTAGIERFTGYVSQLAAVNPEVIDKLDFDQSVDEYGNMIGVPPKVIRSDEHVAQIREQRAQQQQAAQLAAYAQSAAGTAKTLSETSTGPSEDENLLNSIMGPGF